MAGVILAIDQGTTSTRSIVFDAGLTPVASAQEEFTQHFPAPGWVEHDPEDLWRTTAAPPTAARNSKPTTTARWCPPAPACASIPISRPPRSPGCSITLPARALLSAASDV